MKNPIESKNFSENLFDHIFSEENNLISLLNNLNKVKFYFLKKRMKIF